MAYVDEQGRLIPTYPPADMKPDPNFREHRYAPFTRMLAPENRSNLIQFLGGLGADLDPRGFGGALGRGVVNTQRQMDYQKATERSIRRDDDFRKSVFDMVANIGLTPQGKSGGTSIKMNPDSTVTIKADLADQENSQVLPTPETAPPVFDPRRIKQEQTQALPSVPTTGREMRAQPGGPIQSPTSQFQQRSRGIRTPIPKVQPMPNVGDISLGELPPNPKNRGGVSPKTGTVAPSQITIPIEKQSPQSQLQGDSQLQLANALRSTNQATVLSALLASYRPTEIAAPQMLMAPPISNTLVAEGGGFVAPPAETLLPTPRQRSQTMFDVRNFIPF